MLDKALFAATALVVVASPAFATEQRALTHTVRALSPTLTIGNPKGAARVVRNNEPHPTPGAIFSNFGKDKNAEFLSWYALRAVSYVSSSYISQYTWFKISTVGYNAFPFHGGGKLKTMTFAGFASDADMAFKGAILSATASGLPGQALASTASTTFSNTALCCTGARTVKFAQGATNLPDGDYFVAVKCANNPCEGGWNMEDIDYSGATVDYWFIRYKEVADYGGSPYQYTYSTPWHASTVTPAAGAVIIK